MKLCIIGGTGFIGYHTVHECLRRGHYITVLALPSSFYHCSLPENVRTIRADLHALSDERLGLILQEHDGFIFSAGADDRILPRAPAYPFFERYNVLPSVRLVRLASEKGLKRGVILGSYFAHFHKYWPDKEIAKHHPYIRSRVEQEKQALAAVSGNLSLAIIELPYIFGAMPGRIPLWAPLIRYLRAPVPLFYTRGGSNMIAVQHAAEAVAGAVENTLKSEIYLVGDENIGWEDFLKRLCGFIGINKKIRIISNRALKRIMKMISLSHKWMGREAGLSPVHFVEIQTAETYFDPEPSRKKLHYGRGGLDEAFRDTVRACLGKS